MSRKEKIIVYKEKTKRKKLSKSVVAFLWGCGIVLGGGAIVGGLYAGGVVQFSSSNSIKEKTILEKIEDIVNNAKKYVDSINGIEDLKSYSEILGETVSPATTFQELKTIIKKKLDSFKSTDQSLEDLKKIIDKSKVLIDFTKQINKLSREIVLSQDFQEITNPKVLTNEDLEKYKFNIDLSLFNDYLIKFYHEAINNNGTYNFGFKIYEKTNPASSLKSLIIPITIKGIDEYKNLQETLTILRNLPKTVSSAYSRIDAVTESSKTIFDLTSINDKLGFEEWKSLTNDNLNKNNDIIIEYSHEAITSNTNSFSIKFKLYHRNQEDFPNYSETYIMNINVIVELLYEATNTFEWNCNYKYDDDLETTDNALVANTHDDENVDTSIACVYENIYRAKNGNEKGKPTNRFPLFKFYKMNQRFVPLQEADFSLLKDNPEISFGDKKYKLREASNKQNDLPTEYNALVKKQTLLNNEKKARAKMKLFVENYFSHLSYGPEIALLDEIRIINHPNSDFYGITIHPTFQQINVQREGRYPTQKTPRSSNNIRFIEAPIKPLYSNVEEKNFWISGGKVIKRKDYRFHPQDENFSEATFDIYATMYTLSHEYGHHLTLHAENMDAEKLLNKMESLFSNNNDRWEDFKTLYKYFNNMNDWTKSYGETAISLEYMTDNDYEMLKLYRRYYSTNVVSLRSQFTDYTTDSTWQKETYDKIYYGLLKKQWARNSLPQEINTKALAAIQITGYQGIKKDQYQSFLKLLDDNDYNVYVWDRSSIFNFGSDAQYNSFKTFYLVSKNYPVASERKRITMGDIFLNPTYDLTYKDGLGSLGSTATRYSVQRNACSSQPYTFVLDSYNREVVLNLVNGPILSQSRAENEYETNSKILDVAVLNEISYYFTWTEMAARMYASLIFKYPDSRQKTDICSRDYSADKGLAYVALKRVPRISSFYDYGFFKVFNINLLLKEQDLMSFFADKPELLENEYHILNNKLSFYNFQGRSSISESNNFFISYNAVGRDDKNEQLRLTSVYLKLVIKTSESITDFTRVKIMSETNQGRIVRSPYNYNYQNYNVLENTEDDPRINDYDHISMNNLDNNDYYYLLFKLGNYYNNDWKDDNALINWNFNIRVWIDKNDNDVYDEGEVELSAR